MNYLSSMEEIWLQLQKTTWLEAVAMISGLLFPIFSALEKKICWLFGGISSVIYVWLMYDAKLYQDAILNIYYIVMAVVGYLIWTGVIKPKNRTIKISGLNFRYMIVFVLIGLLYTALTGYLFKEYTNASYPFIDSFVTGFAFIATWLESRKKIENWYIFFVVDAVSIWLFWQKGYLLTVLLFIIYCIICIFGIVQWHRKIELSRSL